MNDKTKAMDCPCGAEGILIVKTLANLGKIICCDSACPVKIKVSFREHCCRAVEIWDAAVNEWHADNVKKEQAVNTKQAETELKVNQIKQDDINIPEGGFEVGDIVLCGNNATELTRSDDYEYPLEVYAEAKNYGELYAIDGRGRNDIEPTLSLLHRPGKEVVRYYVVCFEEDAGPRITCTQYESDSMARKAAKANNLKIDGVYERPTKTGGWTAPGFVPGSESPDVEA